MSKTQNFISKIPFIGKSIDKTFFKRTVITQSINGTNNIIRNNGTYKKMAFDIKGDNNQVFIGNNTRINAGRFYLRGNNHKIIIGENCYFGKIEFWIEDENCSILIHNNVTIQQAGLSVTEPYSSLTIGDDCMISNNVEMRTGDSHSIIDIETGERINKAANIIIENHVWVASHTKILKGVTIEKNSVIGTASVVTGNIPGNSIAVGVPAKVVRSGINWDRQRL